MKFKSFTALGALSLIPLSIALTPDTPKAPAKVPGLQFGDSLPSGTLKALDGKEIQMSAFKGKPVLVVMTSASCPVCVKYGPALNRIEDTYAPKGVKVLFVNPGEHETQIEMAKMASANKWSSPYAVGAESLAAQLGARTTAETFLFDASHKLVYRGALDDQYGVGYNKAKPTNEYVRSALDATLKGQKPKVYLTEAPGCVLSLDAKPQPEKVTYHSKIARIIQDNCGECHRDGGVAPFKLDTYEAVTGRKGMIDYVVEKRIMPPWFADEIAKGAPNPWKNDRSLSSSDRETLLTWLKGDLAKGDPKTHPAPKVYTTEWKIGKPDLVLQLPEPVPVQAEGFMDYVEVNVDPKTTEDKWVQGLEIHPTDRSVVHHVLVFIELPRKREMTIAERLQEEIRAVSTFFAGYVPGSDMAMLPDGFARKLPAGAKLRFQLHYTPNGKPTSDQTRLALKYATKPVEREMTIQGMFNFRFRIPANEPNHMVTTTSTLTQDIMLTAFMPHMHVRGKAARYEVTYPDGKHEVLLNVAKYDFNWQLRYEFKQPKLLPKDSKLTYTAWYDNSKDNPSNPDPNKNVFWGDQTTSEMMLGYYDYYKK